MERHWRRQPEPHIVFEDFDEFSAVFCELSGETHVLDAFPTEILRQLSGGMQVSEPAVVNALAALMDGPEDRLREQVSDTLLALERMQIVELSSP